MPSLLLKTVSTSGGQYGQYVGLEVEGTGAGMGAGYRKGKGRSEKVKGGSRRGVGGLRLQGGGFFGGGAINPPNFFQGRLIA